MFIETITIILKQYKIKPTTAWRNIPENIKEFILRKIDIFLLNKNEAYFL